LGLLKIKKVHNDIWTKIERKHCGRITGKWIKQAKGYKEKEKREKK
jgi:hypothetical protein